MQSRHSRFRATTARATAATACLALCLSGLMGCAFGRLWKSDEPEFALPETRAGIEAAIEEDRSRLEAIMSEPAPPAPAKGERDPLQSDSELDRVARRLVALHEALDALDAAAAADATPRPASSDAKLAPTE